MDHKYLSRIMKIAILTAALVAVLFGVQQILRHKCIYLIDETPETEMWEQLYELDKNSIDMVFVGNSHVYNAVNPAVIYEHSGIKSFDIATSNQDLFTSYYLLKEFLSRQDPSVVVLDTYGIFNTPFTAPEGFENVYYKMAFDDMRLSPRKVEAITKWHRNSPEISIPERLFPIFEYHSRWEELNTADFSDGALRSVNLGYAYSFKIADPTGYAGRDPQGGSAEIPDLSYEYFDKIVSLCRDNNASLVLITTPDVIADPAKSIRIGLEADARDILYIDYNEVSKYASTGLNSDSDFRDLSHLNAYGAVKFSEKLIDDLKDCGITDNIGPDNSDKRFIRAVNDHYHTLNARSIHKIEDFETYLKTVKDRGYLIIMAAKGEAFGALTETDKSLISSMFQGIDLSDSWGRSIIGVIGCGIDHVDFGSEVLTYNNTLQNGNGCYVESIGYFAGAEHPETMSVTIKIGQTDYSENEDGLNFVIYDPMTDAVIDSCAFMTGSDNKPVVRSFIPTDK